MLVDPEIKTWLDTAKESGRGQAEEFVRLIRAGKNLETELGGDRVAAIFRTFAAFTEGRNQNWLDDPDLFNTITRYWTGYLDAIRPKRSPIDQTQIERDFEELRLAIQEATPARKRGLRAHARFLAEHGAALDPEWRARFALLGAEEGEGEEEAS